MLLGYLLPPDATALQETPEDQQSIVFEEQTTGDNSVATTNQAGLEDAVVIAQSSAPSLSNDPGRVENLRLATEALDGVVIKPGETFSFNEVVGDVENDSRYRLAPVVLDSEPDYVRGGGVSQVSSALYLAALYTNLIIVERHPHPTNVDFVQAGLDAFIEYSDRDLRLSNQSEFPVKINAVSEGQSVTITLLGRPLADGIRIEPLSIMVTFHAEGSPLPEELDLDSSLINSTFYIVESFRVFYYHGNMTESILLARDTYTVLSGTTVVLPDGSRVITK